MSDHRNADYLAQAVQENTPLQQLMAPRAYSADEKKQAADQANARAAAVAEAAKEQLAQEALLADPAEMRKIFPQVLKDVSLNHNDHLDMAEIQKGLANKALPAEERNFLKVLEYGYDKYRYEPTMLGASTHHFELDQDGVSAGSLAMLDKAVDRKISDDPYMSSVRMPTAVAGFFVNGILAGVLSKGMYGDTNKLAVVFALLGGTVGACLSEKKLYSQRSDGTEDKMYDEIKTGYQSFVADYHNGKVAPPPKVIH